MNCTITARFTPAQADILYVGFRPLILNHINLVQTKYSPGAHPDMLTPKFFGKWGTYNHEIMESIYRLWKGLQLSRGQELRIALEYSQVSACALAVRTAVRQVRRGHVAPWASGIESNAKRLLRQLEAMRKRLKRTITKTEGQTSFRETAYSWDQFLRWARLTLLTCRCLIRRPNLIYRSRQLLIDSMVRVATVELQRSKQAVPPPRILRKLVRDALKNVRKSRTPFTTSLLLRNPWISSWWIAEYVTERMSR